MATFLLFVPTLMTLIIIFYHYRLIILLRRVILIDANFIVFIRLIISLIIQYLNSMKPGSLSWDEFGIDLEEFWNRF